MLKVYKMNDYDWVCSPLSTKETNNWYINMTDCDIENQPIEYVKECDLDSEGMWLEIEDKNKLKEIESIDVDGELEEIKAELGNTLMGDVIRHEGMWCEYVLFREAIKRLGYTNITVPDFIATTEW